MKIQLIDESQKSEQCPKGLRAGILTLGCPDAYAFTSKKYKNNNPVVSSNYVLLFWSEHPKDRVNIPYTTTAMIHPTLTYSDGTEIREGDTGTCSRMWGDCIIILVEERWTLKFDSGQMPDMDYSWSQMLTRTGSIYESGSE